MLSKSVDWFLYDTGLRHERVKPVIRTLSYHNFSFQLLLDFSILNFLWQHSIAIKALFHVFFVALFLATIIIIGKKRNKDNVCLIIAQLINFDTLCDLF